MQYAKQIENAISAYILQHGGTLPAGLATSGEYTICKAGIAAGCNLDLSVLVTEGFLSNIPSAANCESSVSSCYKINYDSATAVLNVEADVASQPDIISGMVGYWKLDELAWAGTSNEVVDSSRSSIHGTAQGSVSTIVGKFGRSGGFNGSVARYVLINDNSLLEPNELTLSVWLKRNDIGTRQIMIGKGDGSSDPTTQYWMEFNTSNRPVFYLSTASVGYSLIANDLIVNDTTSWHHLLMTWDGSVMQIYLDGVKSASTASKTGSITNTAFPFGIGKLGSFGGLAFNGTLDDVRIYNRALDDTEVDMLFDWVPDPIAHWKLDEGSVNSIADSSGNSLSGLLQNSPSWTTGKYNSAVNFDGTNDFIAVTDPGTNSLLDFTSNSTITVTAWIKLNSLPTTSDTYHTILTKGSTDNTNDSNYWVGYGNQGGQYVVGFFFDSASGYGAYYSPIPGLSTGTWIHLAATHQFGNAAAIKMYINGVETAGTWFGNGSYTPIMSNKALWIGADDYSGGSSPDELVPGVVDDVRIYNYVRNQTQILEDMNNL